MNSNTTVPNCRETAKMAAQMETETDMFQPQSWYECVKF